MNRNRIHITGKNAFISGSSRGIGQQIALGLAKQGCHIIVHGRTQENCLKTMELLKAYGVKVYCVSGDLATEDQVQDLINQLKMLNIPIDIVYNNAAVMTPYQKDFWKHSWEAWMLTMKVNVFAMYSICAALIPAMVENNFGRVVNVSSGIQNEPELAPYGASKWAVNKLTKDLAFKFKDTNVRINALDPGWLRTDMGGEFADYPVEAVLPGALFPALIDNDGPNGSFFSAIEGDFKSM